MSTIFIPLEVKLRPELIERLQGLINQPGPLPEYDLSLLVRVPVLPDQHLSIHLHINNDEEKNLDVRVNQSGDYAGSALIPLLNRDLTEKFVVGLKNGFALEISFIPSTEPGV